MNKLLVSLNVILLAAVIVLFYLFLHKKSDTTSPIAHDENVSASPLKFKMGYFELDSLDNNYKYQQDVKAEMISREQNVENQINDLQNDVRQKYEDAQKKGPTMSQSEQTQVSNELQQLSQQNQDKAQRLQQSLGMERQTKMQQVKQTIQNYLKTFAKDQGYNYIIGTYEDDNFYYKDSAQDITNDLVQKLNQLYTDSLKKANK